MVGKIEKVFRHDGLQISVKDQGCSIVRPFWRVYKANFCEIWRNGGKVLGGGEGSVMRIA